jgi:hypothetical protein
MAVVVEPTRVAVEAIRVEEVDGWMVMDEPPEKSGWSGG